MHTGNHSKVEQGHGIMGTLDKINYWKAMVYKLQLRSDNCGHITSCNCKGWTIKKIDKASINRFEKKGLR